VRHCSSEQTYESLLIGVTVSIAHKTRLRILTEVTQTSRERVVHDNGTNRGFLRPVRISNCDCSRVGWRLGNSMVHHVPGICRPLLALILAHTYGSTIESGTQACLLTKSSHVAPPFALSFTTKGGCDRMRPCKVSIPEATRMPVALMKSDDWYRKCYLE